MCLPKIFDNLNFPPINWSNQGSNKKNTIKRANNPINQINGNNNTVSNITGSHISIATTPSTQTDKDECFRLLQTPGQWMIAYSGENYEFLSKVNNNVSIAYNSEHSSDNYKDFISSCWRDNNGKWCDLNVCINNKSIYEDQYCNFDSCFGATVVRPTFDWILKPSYYENIRLHYYYANSEKTIINNFIKHWPSIFTSTKPYLINHYIATFKNSQEKHDFFSYIHTIESIVIELINKSPKSLSSYNCQNMLDERDELDLKSADILTRLLKDWRAHQ